MRTINTAGITLIKSFESFSAAPYLDVGGYWTIGYGHRQGVTSDTPEVTEEEAELLLRADVLIAEHCISQQVKTSLSDNQYAALVSLIYNVGPAPLSRTLGAKLSLGDYAAAADQFLRWRLSGGIVSDGLVRRREAERALFLTPDTLH